MKITKEEMDVIRIQAERGGYTPPGQVSKLVAIIDEYERQISWSVTCERCADQLDQSYAEYVKTDQLTRADECDSLADVMEYSLRSDLSVEYLRKRAKAHRERGESFFERAEEARGR